MIYKARIAWSNDTVRLPSSTITGLLASSPALAHIDHRFGPANSLCFREKNPAMTLYGPFPRSAFRIVLPHPAQ